MSEPTQALVATGVTYYHQNDEAAFFEWLARIPCVDRFEGEGRKLFIHLARAPTDADLRELAAFFYRYRIDMRQLATFASGARRAWFRDPKMYWHRRVFGTPHREG
jgi:hypothetical protein